MPRNPFEQLAELYLRLNGFFLITDFTVHLIRNRSIAEEVDFIGVRFKNSHEFPMFADGNLDYEHPFTDDSKILDMLDQSEITILIGEATMSPSRQLIRERVEKLKNPKRTDYALQRIGDMTPNNSNNAASSTLLRIMFLGPRNQIPEEEKDVKFITYDDMTNFINHRAEHQEKANAVALLPDDLQKAVMLLRFFGKSR